MDGPDRRIEIGCRQLAGKNQDDGANDCDPDAAVLRHVAGQYRYPSLGPYTADYRCAADGLVDALLFTQSLAADKKDAVKGAVISAILSNNINKFLSYNA